MIHEDALASLRREVGKAFMAGTEVFPHYTLHGAEHLEEVDRLALLVGGAIPNFSKARLNLLRLALILHDFAMVQVPSPIREEELRQQMTGDLTFADIVRQVHQDEIERVFTRPEWIHHLAGLFPDEVPHGLEDACTIARHHRLHPLESAPDHVRDLCALMRILDELDIGNRRAPIPAYAAMRSRMEPISRLHWLKHICTRPIERLTTSSVEDKGPGRRVFKAFVAVKATEDTWQDLQNKIHQSSRGVWMQKASMLSFARPLQFDDSRRGSPGRPRAESQVRGHAAPRPQTGPGVEDPGYSPGGDARAPLHFRKAHPDRKRLRSA